MNVRLPVFVVKLHIQHRLGPTCCPGGAVFGGESPGIEGSDGYPGWPWSMGIPQTTRFQQQRYGSAGSTYHLEMVYGPIKIILGMVKIGFTNANAVHNLQDQVVLYRCN